MKKVEEKCIQTRGRNCWQSLIKHHVPRGRSPGRGLGSINIDLENMQMADKDVLRMQLEKQPNR